MAPSVPAPSSLASTDKLERTLWVVGGTLLLAPVLRHRSPWRWGAAAVGGAVIYNGLSGAVRVSDHLTVSGAPTHPVNLHQSITIGRSAVALSSMWRNPDVLTRMMQPLGAVDTLGTDHLRWKVNALGTQLTVECTLAEERPGEMVRWTSVATSSFGMDLRMLFKPAPQGRGTEATLSVGIDFSRTPAGKALNVVAVFLEGSGRMAIRKVLHNFRSLAETGEIPTLERNPSARAHTNSKWNGDLI